MLNKNLHQNEIEFLKALARDGSKAAGKALSKMTGREIELKVSKVSGFPIERVGEIVSDAEAIVTTVYLKITGDVAGSIILVFPNPCALALTDLVSNREPGTTVKLNEFDKSTLKEVSNIISGTFLAVLSQKLSLSLVESIPDLTVDMAQATIDSVLIDFAKRDEQAISIEMVFMSGEEEIEGYFFVLFDTSSAAIILDSVRKKSEAKKSKTKKRN